MITYVVDDGGCQGAGCCVDTVGVFSSLNAIKDAFPGLEFVPSKWGYGQLVKDDVEGYFVKYYVYSFEMDVRND